MYQARYIGLDEVLEAYQEKAKYPYFSLWIGTDPIASYREGDSMDDCIEKITKEINRSIKRNCTKEHILVLHSKKEKEYTRKSDKYDVIGFYAFELPTSNPGLPTEHNSYKNAEMYMAIQQMKSEIAALRAEKIDDEDEDEDDEPEQDDFMSGVDKLMNHPLVIGMVNKYLSTPDAPKNMAGIESPDVNECINVLFSKGVKLEHLQKLAAMPATKINMLLQML